MDTIPKCNRHPGVAGWYFFFFNDFEFSIKIQGWRERAPGWLSWYKNLILGWEFKPHKVGGAYLKNKKIKSLVFTLSNNNPSSKYISGAGKANLLDPQRDLRV